MSKWRFLVKLKSNKGESIAEVLVAVLFTVLASILFASMLTVSARIVQKSETKMNQYYQESSADGDTGNLQKVEFKDSSGNTLTINGKSSKSVTVYQNSGKTASYYITNN